MKDAVDAVDRFRIISADVLRFHDKAYGTDLERKHHKSKIKNMKKFWVLETSGGFIFAPLERHNGKTNVLIHGSIVLEISSSSNDYTRIDDGYLSYTGQFLIPPSVHKMQRRYWLVNVADGSDYPDEVDLSRPYYEGAVKQVAVNKYERNPDARRACIAYYGTACSVCNFDFGVRYGKIGANFIHVHHLTPLHLVGEEYRVDPINDLRPVCPNCHAMLHQQKEFLSIEQLKTLLHEN